jgi:hypothetical protein
MSDFFKNIFKKTGHSNENSKLTFSDEAYEQDYRLKTEALENVLGKMADVVGHAIVPFSVGGAVDMYYFPNHIEGTGFATMELLEPDGSGPLPNRDGTYELLAFTKYPYQNIENEGTPFNTIEREICGIFTQMGFYSRQAVLNVNDTCEIPGKEGEENTCLLFVDYKPEGKEFHIGERKHHLLLCIRVYKCELEYAQELGTEALIELMKEEGIYPYSDLDREPII